MLQFLLPRKFFIYFYVRNLSELVNAILLPFAINSILEIKKVFDQILKSILLNEIKKREI